MKAIAALLMTALLPAFPCQADEALQGHIEEGKGIIQAFFGDLKGELVKSMKANGPVAAIETCHMLAPHLAQAHSERSGWQVGRTSLKPRNPGNAPDAWERAVLQEFEARKAAGEAPEKLMKAEVVEEKGRKLFRMMKAIPTAEVCTKCHGTEIAGPVAARLDELYPEDQARGFKVGDLRGAFTLKKPL